MSSYIPTRESQLALFAVNMNTLLNADPVAYGLTVAQAGDYENVQTAFSSALQTANDPSTRTPSAIVAKDDAKAALIAKTRELVNIIQANPDVTNAQRSDLGITIRDTEPSPVPVPKTAPGIDIVSSVSRTVTLRLHDIMNPDTRGRPNGTEGATIMSYVGATAPDPNDVAEWKYEGIFGRTSTTITFPSTVPAGATAWFTASWFNPAKESGPWSAAVSAQIPGTQAMAA